MEYHKELRGFVDKDLKSKQLPSKAGKKQIALQLIAEKFTLDKE